MAKKRTKKKVQPQRDYKDFADLYDKPDDKVMAFIRKHGALGLNRIKAALHGIIKAWYLIPYGDLARQISNASLKG